ncbi:hypothetical protein [Shewanella litorisediminis]|uniref:KfrA N-terminal DNA-binding domain-containing protein n=1 Tax=Shewanella litorisediminis TaxID=1173586 RepID=A0ABX7G6F2_9GAMM|nr:hypothetical protein [Shewanella litorisediminis]MCL2916977.1 hypothetical protein [Shewanella litorisediminis]QRH02865.1 hypothetical protein JQC75_05490 [Shewanella litorisediminis]
MSQIEQVLAVARSLELKGLEPSVALIKANLAKSVPMPVIIKGLTQFKQLSHADKVKLTTSIPEATEDAPASELDALQQRVAMLETLCQQLNERIKTLEEGKH